MKSGLTYAITFSLVTSCFAFAPNQKHNFFIGKWKLISIGHNSSVNHNSMQSKQQSASIACNVCPDIIFIADTIGVIEFPDKSEAKFKWEYQNNYLKIINIENTTQSSLISDGFYKINIIKDSPKYIIISLYKENGSQYNFIKSY